MNASSLLLVIAAAIFIWVAYLWMRAFRRRGGPDAFVIAQLERAGLNLARAHDIEFFLYFPTQEAAERASVKVAALGMVVKVDRAATGEQWLVFATRNMVPAEKEMARLRRAMEAIAAAEQGEYDGWGAPVTK